MKTMDESDKAIVLLTAFALIFVLLLGMVPSRSIAYRDAEYVVRQGDTLWQIAAMYCHPDEDKRDWIADVTRANNISGWIQPGEKLIVKEWIGYEK